MPDDSFQNDFFKDQFSEKKGRKTRFLGRHPGQRFLPHVRVPVEYTVILAIGMLVLIIVSYAMGVEKGKRFPAKALEAAPVETAFVADEEGLTDMLLQPGDGAGYPETPGEKKPDTGEKEEIKEKEEEDAKIRKKVSIDSVARYNIQLVTFKKERLARREVTKLKRKGFDADLAKSGRWYQVYATGYKTIDEAKKAQKELAEDYEDCYVRRVK